MLLSLGTTVCFAVSACGGSDNDASDPSTDALSSAGDVAALSSRVNRLTEDLADATERAQVEQIERELRDARAHAEQIADRTTTGSASRSLRAAAQADADAAGELEETAAALAAAIAAGEPQREVSEQASSELAGEARNVRRVKIRVEAAGDELDLAVRQLRDALGALRSDSQLEAGAKRRIREVRNDIAVLGADARQAVSLLDGRVESEADQLRARSEELKPEPPDVVLDCTSTFVTTSDVSVRNMSCAEADGLILQAIPSLAPSFTVGEFGCTILGDYAPANGLILGASDVRCESGDRAFRFDFAD